MSEDTPSSRDIEDDAQLDLNQPLTGTQTLAAISVTFALMAAGVVLVRKSKQIVRMLVS